MFCTGVEGGLGKSKKIAGATSEEAWKDLRDAKAVNTVGLVAWQL